jgi:hemerythrin-like domain-containing protein
MKSVCNHIILTYLDDEQAILLPIISNPILRQKFRDHHAHIRQLARALNKIEPHEDPGLGFFALIGDAIDDYVRWEERVLFPTIESDLSEEQLRSLERSSRNMDIRRQRPTQVLHRSVSP